MTDAEERDIRGSRDELPPLLTEEEAERKAAMMKAAAEVAEAVDEMKRNLEARGWSLAEQAALTLFNTMLMTAFGEQMKSRFQGAEKKLEQVKERIELRAFELAQKRGFADGGEAVEVLKTCMQMIMDDKEAQARSVWEDFHGEGTAGVLVTVAKRARDEIAEEIRKEDERRG